MFNWETIASVAAAGGVGGLIVNWVGGAQARRECRAQALTAVRAVEHERWEVFDPERESPKLERAITELHTRALVARVPRRVVDRYVALARLSAYKASESVAFEDADPDMPGLPTGLANVVRESAAEMVSYAWRPHWARLRGKLTDRRLNSSIGTLHESLRKRYATMLKRS